MYLDPLGFLTGNPATLVVGGSGSIVLAFAVEKEEEKYAVKNSSK